MKSLISLSILFASIMIMGCGSDPEVNPTPVQLKMEELTGSYSTTSSKTWTVSNVMYETSENRTSQWTGFTLKLSTDGSGNGTYETTSWVSGGPWPQSGSWSFKGSTDASTMVREDLLEMYTVVNSTASPNTLELRFYFMEGTHTSGGKVDAVTGEYVFSFTSN